MKNQVIIIRLIVISLLAMTSCSNNITDTKERSIKVDSTKAKVDTTNSSSKIIPEIENEEPAKIICKLFFKGFDFTEEEVGENIIGTVEERKAFNKNKSYTFCYDSEGFHHLTISGSGNNLSFTVTNRNKLIFIKNIPELKSSLKFTDKDFDFIMGEKYSILIKQNENIIFKGNIDSQGCM